MRKRQLFGIVSVFGMAILASGCITSTGQDSTKMSRNIEESTDKQVVLSERQQQILKEENLPTDYEKLTVSQKMAIASMEEMLQYAEKKYNESFLYAGYVFKSVVEEEHMIAYPENGDKEEDCFTITKTDDGYEDNYVAVKIQDDFIDYIYDNIISFSNDTPMRVYGTVLGADMEKLPDAISEVDGKVTSSLLVFLDGETFDAEDIQEFEFDVASVLREHELYGQVQFILLNKGILTELSKYNYLDYLDKKYYTIRDDLYINAQQDRWYRTGQEAESQMFAPSGE